MAGTLHNLRFHQMAVDERDNQVLFVHRVIPGAADRSYGVHVAKLAGIPASVIERAEQLLQQQSDDEYNNKDQVQ
jgi:DNA mismatch repair protein MutS